jgi:hypothetical protein
MRSRITATICVAAALALPATAAARVLEDPPLHPASPPQPRTVTIVRHTDDTLPIAVASAALLVAMASAGLTIVRRAPRRVQA